MSERNLARDLLFGRIALETGLVDKTSMIAAVRNWAREQDRSLKEHLFECGAIDDSRSALVEHVVAEYATEHERGLNASMSAASHTREPLTEVAPERSDAIWALLADQDERWGRGERPLVDTYLAGHPFLRQDPRSLLDLIANEIFLREQRGETISADDYARRFPNLAGLILEQFKIHRLFQTEKNAEQGPGSGFAKLEEDLRGLFAQAGSTHGQLGDQRPPEADDGTVTAVQPNDLAAVPAPSSVPIAIGRYQVIRLLGQGGFGWVYLARDLELDRLVAVKVFNLGPVAGTNGAEAYLAEARTLAKLDHPHIVPVYDVGQTSDGLCYVVSKYIAGRDLSERLRQGRFTARESARIVATVAGALHHAHTRGLVHRDIKPANILLDADESPSVADFGLALADEDYGKVIRIAGTPAYMSPEQTRGEGHRLDGRSDIFSLGVVFYELLTGRKPFRGNTPSDLMEEIARSDERPPRQIDDTIPRELERICEKMLAKRASERYSTARDLADDLGYFLQTDLPAPVRNQPATSKPSTREPREPPDLDSRSAPRVVPKGLRSFDRTDADFFLELLPGPRDRDGLPDSLRFWKTRVESPDTEAAFKVGLIYGPSGCGKSSLVKAGLIPRLAKNVLPVYVEATPDDTEARLLETLRKTCPDLAPGLSLVESLAALRRGRGLGSGERVLLVLDQLEQWLFANGTDANSELVAALRQCDGERVLAIVMVRDDFWMAASRFMKDLEIRLREGENSAAVDLFDDRHARKVLAAFGKAYGVLPDRSAQRTADQEAFIDQAVAGLAKDGRVVSVRLALLAEMVKSKPWTPSTLRAVGGTRGVGVTFLEETFSPLTAPPQHRLHQKAARLVLKALLPESGTDIKGQMRSHQELLVASGYAAHPHEFAELLRILDGELRLITPTDPAGLDSDGASRPLAQGKYYQLTHDYLVHSLREWLNRKQRETRRGRAELRLEERAALWNTKAENRFLPSAWEWCSIRCMTAKHDWTEPQRLMMKRAARVHGLRAVLALFILIAITGAGLSVRRRAIDDVKAAHASGLVQQLLRADSSRVAEIINAMRSYRPWVEPELKREVGKAPERSSAKLHASLALLQGDPAQADYLYERMLDADPAQLWLIWNALHDYHGALSERLWHVLEAPDGDPDRRFHAACALASHGPASSDERWDAVSAFIADRLLVTVVQNPSRFAPVVELLRPLRSRLTAPLAATFRSTTKPESFRSLATSILADYAGDQTDVMVDLLLDAEPQQFAVLLPKVQSAEAAATDALTSELARKPAPAATDAQSDRLIHRQALAAIALIRLGHGEQAWPLLRHSPDPGVRSTIVTSLSPLGVSPSEVAAKLAAMPPDDPSPAPKGGQAVMDGVLFDPQTSFRRALILALGEYEAEAFSAVERAPLVARLLETYRKHPDAGIHGAAEWTLRRWKEAVALKDLDARLPNLGNRGNLRWYVNSERQTLAVIDGPVEFTMGAPESEAGRFPGDVSHRQRISRRFALATKEVSVEQFQRFLKKDPRIDRTKLAQYSPDPSGPIIDVNWYEAAAYCNWLSRQENLKECYEPNAEGHYAEGMKIVAGSLDLPGYRLPTEAEWEYACRAGTVTSRYHGRSVELLGKYAWYIHNSNERAWPCGELRPNDLGLFDMLGNVYEWCQGQEFPYPTQGIAEDQPTQKEPEIIEERLPRVLRGGAFTYRAANVRSANRNRDQPSYPGTYYGFRPARTVAP